MRQVRGAGSCKDQIPPSLWHVVAPQQAVICVVTWCDADLLLYQLYALLSKSSFSMADMDFVAVSSFGCIYKIGPSVSDKIFVSSNGSMTRDIRILTQKYGCQGMIRDVRDMLRHIDIEGGHHDWQCSAYHDRSHPFWNFGSILQGLIATV